MKLKGTQQVVDLRTKRVPVFRVFVSKRGSLAPVVLASMGLLVGVSGRVVMFSEN